MLLKTIIDVRRSSATTFTWPQVSLSLPSILACLVLVSKFFAGLAIGVTCLGVIIQLLFIPFRLWFFSRESFLFKIFVVFVSYSSICNTLNCLHSLSEYCDQFRACCGSLCGWCHVDHPQQFYKMVFGFG